ncbi:MAG: hypothetical protein PHQ75_04970 [Thermoguttaceae bacterium]|nr:hypothetical protein [Thermoguttaceae bacterium]
MFFNFTKYLTIIAIIMNAFISVHGHCCSGEVEHHHTPDTYSFCVDTDSDFYRYDLDEACFGDEYLGACLGECLYEANCPCFEPQDFLPGSLNSPIISSTEMISGGHSCCFGNSYCFFLFFHDTCRFLDEEGHRAGHFIESSSLIKDALFKPAFTKVLEHLQTLLFTLPLEGNAVLSGCFPGERITFFCSVPHVRLHLYLEHFLN